MNPLKKVYCRIYQTCFKIALPVLPYRKPKRLKNMEELANLFVKKKCHSVMIVTDSGIRALKLTRKLEKELTAKGIQYVIYDKTDANPTTNNVEEALFMYHENGCQALVGFGGGSSIDCAKAVGARVAKPNQSLAKMKGILKIHKKLPLLVAIPTTAGTGSEATLASVIVDSETRHKYPINDFPLIPRYTVLEPRVTLSLPPFITATTGMDALTHAVEAFIGNSTTAGTRTDAYMAVDLIFHNLDTAVFQGDDIEARKNMLKASYYAGCAFTKSYVGYVHAIAHSLGGKYNVAHGYANAVILPYLLEAYGEKIHRKLYILANAAGLAKEDTPIEEAAQTFIDEIKSMQERYGIGNKIAQIRQEDIEEMALCADKEANPLYPVPVLMNAKELEKFYYMIME